MKKLGFASLFLVLLFGAAPAFAADYVIDTKGAHAAIQFKIKHLGYSWLVGRFNKFEGGFSYDEKNPAASKVEVIIDAASVDSNHAERDKHLRGKDFLEVDKFPTASFIGTSFEESGDGKAVLKGDLTLHGVTRPIVIDVEHIGHGPDPWGGYRRGFAGTTTLTLKDFGITRDLGPASAQVQMFLYVEGVRR
jgi:polyisoprenoid-binding protein YceI